MANKEAKTTCKMKCKECTAYYCQYRTTNAEKDCYYEQQNTKQFDWQSFLAEATKDFVAALVSVIDYEHTTDENIVKCAINLSEELVKQLKEKIDVNE